MRYSVREHPIRQSAHSAVQHLATLKWAAVSPSLVAFTFLFAIVLLP